jgi:CRP-like cAMP-binding protein
MVLITCNIHYTLSIFTPINNGMMIICEDLLFSHGAKTEEYNAGDSIFEEGTAAKYYFQIRFGTVKLNTLLEDGKNLYMDFRLTDIVLGKAICLPGIIMPSMPLLSPLVKSLKSPKINF